VNRWLLFKRALSPVVLQRQENYEFKMKRPHQKSQGNSKGKKQKIEKTNRKPKEILKEELKKPTKVTSTRKTRSEKIDETKISSKAEPQPLKRQKYRTTTKPEQAKLDSAQPPMSSPERSTSDHDMGMEEDAHQGGTLHHLLGRLGAGFEDIPIFGGPSRMGGIGGGSSARMKAILLQLKHEDESVQLAALTDLCELISISTEESMVSFPTEQTVPLLVNFLNIEHNPDIMLLAARAITFLADVFPPSCSAILRHSAVPALAAKLLTIEYIDLAEQSLQALEKLSHDHPSYLLRSGALVAVLSFIDFFATGVQRVAVATAANICRGLSSSPQEHVDAVSTAAPILIGLLQYQDARIVDSACLALTRITEAYSASPKQLELLCNLGLVQSIAGLVAVNESGTIASQLSSGTFYGLIKLLATAATASATASEALVRAGISKTLYNLLMTSPLIASSSSSLMAAAAGGGAGMTPPPGTATTIGGMLPLSPTATAVVGSGIASPSNILRNADQLLGLVALTVALLPPIPDAIMLHDIQPMNTEAMDADDNKEEERGRDSNKKTATAATREEELSEDDAARIALFKSNPDILNQMVSDLLPLMLKIHGLGITLDVKRLCLDAMARMLFYASPVTLKEPALEDLPISSMVAALLTSPNSNLVAHGMQLAEIIMQKVPDSYQYYFLKEGVVHAIDQLAALAVEEKVDEKEKEGKGKEPVAVAATGRGRASSSPMQEDNNINNNNDNSGGGRMTRSRARSLSAGPPACSPTAATEQAKTSGEKAAAAAAASPGDPTTNRHTAAITPVGDALKSAAAIRARNFKAKYFAGDTLKSAGAGTAAIGGSGGSHATEGMRRLSALCNELLQSTTDDDVHSIYQAVQGILMLCTATGSDRISTFELISSGCVQSLGVFLSGQDLLSLSSAEKDTTGSTTRHEVKILKRLAAFATAALPRGSGGSPPLTSLVDKLLDALGSTETFPVFLHAMSSTSTSGAIGGHYRSIGGGGVGGGGGVAAGLPSSLLSASLGSSRAAGNSLLRTLSGAGSMRGETGLSAGLNALSNPLKIRLVRSGGAEEKLKDYSMNVVLIEPLASLTQVESFLWPRVNKQTTATTATDADTAGGSGSRGVQQQGAAAAAAGHRPRATSALPVPQPRAAVAAATIAGGGNDNSIGGSSGSRRLTRAQARAVAEAEVAAQPISPVADNIDAMSEDNDDENDDDIYLPPTAIDEGLEEPAAADGVVGEEGMHHDHEGMDDDDDDEEYENMEEDEYYDEDDEGGEEEEDEMDRPVMNMHLTTDDDGGAGTAAAAATARGRLSSALAAARTNTAGVEPQSITTRQQQQQQQQPPPPQSYASVARGQLSNNLIFSVAGRDLDPDTTMFHAVQAAIGAGSASSQAAHSNVGRRLWGDVHIISYRLPGDDDSKRGGRGGGRGTSTNDTQFKNDGDQNQDISGSVSGMEEKERCSTNKKNTTALLHLTDDDANNDVWSSPLSELLSPVLDAETLKKDTPTGVSDEAVGALMVLCRLEALNRLAPHLLSLFPDIENNGGGGGGGGIAVLPSSPQTAAAAAAPAAGGRSHSHSLIPIGHIPAPFFISSKLSTKLNQQLKDVLSICGGSIPAWCGVLVKEGGRFLFPFDIRRKYFYCSAFGLARAVNFLQQNYAVEQQQGGGGGMVGVGGAGGGGGAAAAAHAAADRHAAAGLRIARIQRQKVRINRSRIFQSAHKVFQLQQQNGLGVGSSGINKGILEIEYFDEVGSGLGPTLEFYTLLSHEFQKKSLGIWRDEDTTTTTTAPTSGNVGSKSSSRRNSSSSNKDGGVSAPQGLFPAPMDTTTTTTRTRTTAATVKEEVLSQFKLLGQVVAKALQDNRLLDLPLSPVFYRLALGGKADVFDLRQVDAGLGASVETLYRAAMTASSCGENDENSEGSVVVDGCPLEDLCLTYELPGYPDYDLSNSRNGFSEKKNEKRNSGGGSGSRKKDSLSSSPIKGSSITTLSQLKQWISAVVDATLGTGISSQLDAFKQGFDTIFPLSSLACFAPEEVEHLLCGSGEIWTVDMLSEVVKFDHGYTKDSAVVRYLLQVMSEMDEVEQRHFLRFVTGCPRLPAGGLAAMQPRLTVVRKMAHVNDTSNAGGTVGDGTEGVSSSLPDSVGNTVSSSFGRSLLEGNKMNPADGHLPSVMTCANYIKLPPYSSKEVLKERLLFAINEGQGSFDLS
jgi:E3 ubiquitin-protein ligase TRIP12